MFSMVDKLREILVSESTEVVQFSRLVYIRVHVPVETRFVVERIGSREIYWN